MHHPISNRQALVVASVMLLAALASIVNAQQPNAHDRPNLIVIFTDDQTFGGIGYNNPDLKTPHLDALARSGLIIERAYVASPICAASRASMMSGVFPQQHGVISLARGNFKRYHTGGDRADLTLAHQLHALGYTTGFYGKSHIGKPTDYGFDVGEEIGQHDDVPTFAKAEQFLRDRATKDKPFFLWVAPHQPHVPLLPDQRWLDLYDPAKLTLPGNFREQPTAESINNQGRPGEDYYRDSKYTKNYKNLPAGPPRDEPTIREFIHAYYAVISHLDDQVGHLVKQLDESGLRKNTVIVYLADNGYHLGSHGLGNKITMHEESVRVPMFITGPGAPAGRRTKALVSSLDVYPTLLELASAKTMPEQLMGKSLVPLLRDPDSQVRDTVFSECVGVGGKPGEGHRMARGDTWKYVLTGANEPYVFNERDDPSELKNRITDPAGAEAASALRAQLVKWMGQISDRSVPQN
ncbi:MAG: sulfatase-like hydrolase/transferase [Phycisphaera sp.]|nr:sulfatase-like hydrolase/transferase [Phycisphaera sp.]